MLFTDELDVQVAAGKGGDGAVHFARIKYQPFAGPDGGDGGRGGDVILAGSRSVEDLTHLRTAKLKAEDGGNGMGNLMIGLNGRDLEVRVPPGTIALGTRTAIEAGSVMNSTERVVIARGGKGGKGNVHLASGRQRTPKTALPGQPGVELSLTLRYRIACEVALIEPAGELEDGLLPELLGVPKETIDYDLYRRKPRWVRLEHEYRRYDIAYLPFDYYEGVGLEMPAPAHVYWAKRLIVNLLPLGEFTADAWPSLLELLQKQEYRRLERLVVISGQRLFATAGPVLQTEGEEAGSENRLAAGAGEAREILERELCGGVVE